MMIVVYWRDSDIGRLLIKRFPDFPASLINVDYRDLQKWMKEKKELWGSIFERAVLAMAILFFPSVSNGFTSLSLYFAKVKEWYMPLVYTQFSEFL